MIYLDHAATSFHKPESVIHGVADAMRSMGNYGRGTHDQSLTAGRTVYETRALLADFFGCSRPDHVVFTANATEALNISIHGLFASGDHIITTDLEHNSVLRPLYQLEDLGVNLSFVPADQKGCINYLDFERLVQPETKAIICTHASNLTGNLLDIKRIGQVARKHGLLFLVDVSQTAGTFPIHMQEMCLDVLCFTGHKGLLGPQGTGGLCIREGIKIRPWKVGGSGVLTYQRSQPEQYPEALEAGTLNGHGIAGLKAGIEYIGNVGLDSIRKQELTLAKAFFEGVKSIEGVRVYGDFSTWERAPIVALNIGELDSSAVSDELARGYEIATRPGAHCAPRMHQALGTIEQGAVRFSFSHFNTMEEVLIAAEAVAEIARRKEI